MTTYDKEIERLQGLVLDALREHTEPEAIARQFMRAAFPDTAAAASGIVKPLPAPQQEQLANVLHAAAGQLMRDAKAAGQQAMQYRLNASREQPVVAEFLDAVLWLASQQPPAVDAGVPALLLEQITEGVSIQECEAVFAYLDSRTPTFKQPQLEPRSRLTLLRTCNMLLKRLSKSANAMLCGRILLFLAKLLPLTERSGVNLTGLFNTDNTTPVEEVQEGALDSEGKLVDAPFYRTFWGLQSYFSNPPAVLQTGKWAEVSRDVKKVLEKFRQEKVTVGEGGGDAGFQGGTVKYLSSSRLMGLQLRDATFRRHFLLQCLILMQWCERPRQKDRLGLRGKLLEDLQDLRAKVYAELEATPDRGREFAAAVRHLIQWEDSWAAWKQLSCPAAPLEQSPAQPPAGYENADLTAPAPKRRRPGPDAFFGVRVGTEELDRLWNLTEDNTSALSADDRGGFKSARQLLEPVLEGMREAAAGEDEALLMKPSRSKLYSWKALRFVARTNLQAFAAAVQKGGDLEVAARVMYPSECPPPAPEPAPVAAQHAPPSDGVDADKGDGAAGSQGAADRSAGAGSGEGDADGGGPADLTGAGAQQKGDAEMAAADAAAEAGGEEEEEGELPDEGGSEGAGVAALDADNMLAD